jgi:transcriptional regulator with XRE-family HTH domain
MNLMTFGERLAEARRVAGLTQEQLGVGLGSDGRDLGKGAVSSWENGGSHPSSAQVAKICDRLNISADHLLGVKARVKERA